MFEAPAPAYVISDGLQATFYNPRMGRGHLTVITHMGSPGLRKDPHRIPSLPKRLIRPIIVSNGSRRHGNLTRDLSELEPFLRKVPVIPA